MQKLDEMRIPEGVDYLNMDGLALEARQKLNEKQPMTMNRPLSFLSKKKCNWLKIAAFI